MSGFLSLAVMFWRSDYLVFVAKTLIYPGSPFTSLEQFLRAVTLRGHPAMASQRLQEVWGLQSAMVYIRVTLLCCPSCGFGQMCNDTGASQAALVVKCPPADTGDIRDVGSIPGSGRSPGEGHDLPGSESVFGISQDIPMCEHLSAKVFCTKEAYG